MQLPDAAATEALAAQWAPHLGAPLVVYLYGDLGAGKTTFVRALLRALGFTGAVKSPTYSLVETYALPELVLNHFDLYRFGSPEEWLDGGFDEMIHEGSIALIEWPQMGAGALPPPDVALFFRLPEGAAVLENPGRLCKIVASSPLGLSALQSWLNTPAVN